MGVTESVSAVVLQPPNCIRVDRYDRIKRLRVFNAVKTPCVTALIFTLLRGFDLLAVAVLPFERTGASGFYGYSVDSVLPDALERERLA